MLEHYISIRKKKFALNFKCVKNKRKKGGNKNVYLTKLWFQIKLIE